MSASQPTLDDVWQLFRETDRQLQESRREMDRRLEASRQEAEASRREMDRRMEESRQAAERDRQEANIRSKELDEQIKALSVQIGNLGNRLGEFVEEQVMPSALALIQARGIEVHEIQRRVKAKRSGRTAEIDLLLTNDTDLVAVEVKSTLSLAYVDQHVNRLDQFKILFPRYAGLRVYGAVAGMVVPDESIQYAIAQGLFVLVPSADMMQVANPPEFQPRIW